MLTPTDIVEKASPRSWQMLLSHHAFSKSGSLRALAHGIPSADQ